MRRPELTGRAHLRAAVGVARPPGGDRPKLALTRHGCSAPEPARGRDARNSPVGPACHQRPEAVPAAEVAPAVEAALALAVRPAPAVGTAPV
jgi:hypothetical protein